MTPRLFDKYKTILIEKHGVTLLSWEKGLDLWTKKFGNSENNLADFVWSVFNEVINLIGQSFKNEEDLYTRQRDVYFSMWEYLRDENRDASHVKKQINKFYLLIEQARDRNSDFVTKIHLIANKCCPECEPLDEMVLSVEEAIKLDILPFKACTRKNGCVCCYSSMMARDEETDRLLRK